MLKKQVEGREVVTDSDKQKRCRNMSELRTITLPGKDYQLRKSEMEREYDVLGASLEMVRSAFFRPFTIQRKNPANAALALRTAAQRPDDCEECLGCQ